MAVVEEMRVAAQAPTGSEAATKLDAAGPAAAAGGTAPQAPTVANAPGPTEQEIGFAVTFTRIISVLSRSPHYKHYTLSDLEWLVVPPILTRQCAVMEAQVHGRQIPVAVALWASVSPEVSKRLRENLTTPYRLRPDEWSSGENFWLIDAIGDSKALPLLLQELQLTSLKDREVNMRTLGTDGRPVIGRLGRRITNPADDALSGDDL